MGLENILIIPLLIFVSLWVYFWSRLFVQSDKRILYFGIFSKIIGALALGLIYQFYYGGGDTFNYFSDGKIIASAIRQDFHTGLSLLLSDGSWNGDTFEYSSKLIWYSAQSEFTISKISAVFGLLFFDSYYAIAICFALFSFSGLWAWYKALCKLYPDFSKEIGIAIFFIPSVIFWGSGLMKDTIALGTIGWLFYSFYRLFIAKNYLISSSIIFLLSIWLLYTIRIYILLAYLPPAAMWVFLENRSKIRNTFLKKIAMPFFLIGGILISTQIATTITEGDTRYDLDNINRYVEINSEYLYYLSMQQGGSAYYLGDHDGTMQASLRLAPKAIWVTMFRPYLWESNNIVMLISAMEAFIMLIFTIFVFYKVGIYRVLKTILKNPYLQFALTFTLFIAIAVGLTSYNFGTLVRYKIPLIPFYTSALLLIYRKNRPSKTKRD